RTTMLLISSEDIPHGLSFATDPSMDLPSLMITITWLLIDSFPIIILVMDSAPHVECSDVVPCGAYVDIKNYPTDGLATISNSTSLLRRPNYKQPLQTMP